jgi:3',5'-cyclic AMP phosphodiesterase CpdA
MQARGPNDHVTNLPAPLQSGFPFVRIFGRFALIGINSAVPTPPAVASGTVGLEQCERFAAISKFLHQHGYVRIVLIHHPPLPEHGRRALTDAPAFEKVLIEAGADLVLHGHNHRPMISWRDTSTGPLPIIGAGAAGEGVYNLYRLTRDAGNGLRIEITERAGQFGKKLFAQRSYRLIDLQDAERDTVL